MNTICRHWASALATALAAALAGIVAGPASAAEIVLEPSAVQKLVMQGLFRDNGRYYLQKGACTAWLENPAVTFSAGRIVIRSHLNGRLGIDTGMSCVGIALTAWTTLSGVPGAQGAIVRLADLRVDDVDDPNARMLLNSGLVASLPGAIELNVLKSVQDMLQGASGQIQSEVQALTIQSVGVVDNKLSVRFDFRLLGR